MPTQIVRPPCVDNLIDKFLMANALGGLVPFDWQKEVLASWLGVNHLNGYGNGYGYGYGYGTGYGYGYGESEKGKKLEEV